MRVLLANDTGLVNHAGCQGVSDAHARMLGRRGHHVVARYFLGDLDRFRNGDPAAGMDAVLGDAAFRESLEAVDAVVVNGEGTIHHGVGTEYLNVLAAAARLGKTTLLVNCVLEAMEGFGDVFAAIDDIVVRDRRSACWLERLGVRARILPDSYIEAHFEGPPLLDLAGRDVVTDWHHARDGDVGAQSLAYLRRGAEPGAFFLPLMSGDLTPQWRRLPATLAGARVVVTGRHHGVYAALLAGAPFVALSSNTHKVGGLLDQFPALAFCLDPASIPDAVERALESREAYRAMREAILGARPLSTFDALRGAPDPEGEAREVARLAADVLRRATSGGDDLAYRLARRSHETGAAVAAAPRDVAAPAKRKLRTLIYVEPAMLRDDPLLLSAWVRATSRWAAINSDEMDFFLATAPVLSQNASPGLAGLATINSSDMVSQFSGDVGAYMRDLCLGDASANAALRHQLEEIKGRFDPDIVLSWTENAYLKAAFHDRAVVFTEHGPLPRSGCLLVSHLDPFGHQLGSVFDRFGRMQGAELDYRCERRWIEEWRARVSRAAQDAGLRDWISALPRTNGRVLVALQPTDWFTYQGIGCDLSPLAYLQEVAERTGPDVAVIAQWHPAQDAPDPESLAALARQFPNIVVPPPPLTHGHSDYLVQHVDEVATVSSNVAVLGAVLGRRVHVHRATKFAALATAPSVAARPRWDVLRFLLSRYCDPCSEWAEAPGLFARRLHDVATAPEAMLAPMETPPDRPERFFTPGA